MPNILKQFKQQKQKLEELTAKYQAITELKELYSGWNFAYREAIFRLCENGTITKEQRESLYSEATKYYELYKSH